MLSKEEKLKDPYYKEMKNKVKEVYDFVEPYILKDEELLTYFRYSMLNGIDDEEKESHKDLLTYYKYRLAEYMLGFKKEENKELYDNLTNFVKDKLSNGFLNRLVWHIDNMEALESDALIYEILKDLYLIEKYKGTPFSTDLLKYYRRIIRHEDIKPKKIIPSSEITDENKEEVLKAIDYYEASIKYQNIKKAFYGYLDGLEYNKKVQVERVEKYLVDEFYLYNYNYLLKTREKIKEEMGEDTKNLDPLEPLKVHLKRTTEEAEAYFKLKEEIRENREKLAKKYGVNITLDDDDIIYINEKKEEIYTFLGKFNYSYLDFINWNSLTYMLGLDEGLQETLHDPNEDKSFKDIIEERKKKIEKDKKEKKTIKPHLATKEEIDAIYNKEKTHYKTGSTPTNKMILDTYGAYSGIENNDLDKVLLKIQDLNKKVENSKTKEDKDELLSELKLLEQKKAQLEQLQQDLISQQKEKEDNLESIRKEYLLKDQEQQLSKSDKQQYETLIRNLENDLTETKHELALFNSRGVVFRGNLFNELEYIDDKGHTITTLRDKDGKVLNPKDVPTLADAFLRIANDIYLDRQANYNEFIGKIDDLFPKDKGITYKLANETIKKHLGKNGFILDIKSLLTLLKVSDENIKYYSRNLQEAIKFFNDIQISVQQKDKKFNNDDALNVFFGITNNVYMSRQLNNNIYIYYEISSMYESILDNSNKNLYYQTPIALLQYATGQQGNKRVFKLGDYVFRLKRDSLNGGRGGLKMTEDSNYYKRLKVSTLLKVLRDSGLIKEARPRKYREDVFNKFISALDTLEEEGLIKYVLYYDDSVSMSNDTFKMTFENSLIDIIYLDDNEEYEDILAKNLKNRKTAKLTNANKFILTWGKYEGKTLKEVLAIDKAYLEWILTSDIKISKPKITRQHIKNILENEKAKEQLKK